MSTHRVPCAECGEPTDPWASSTLQEVVGWTKPRSGGGVHHVLFKQTTGRVMCAACAIRRQHTGSAGQEALL